MWEHGGLQKKTGYTGLKELQEKHRKRLEKKRELNMHKETMDVAKRENSELREELVAVQRQIEQAHRKLIDEEVKRRKNARRDGGAQNA